MNLKRIKRWIAGKLGLKQGLVVYTGKVGYELRDKYGRLKETSRPYVGVGETCPEPASIEYTVTETKPTTSMNYLLFTEQEYVFELRIVPDGKQAAGRLYRVYPDGSPLPLRVQYENSWMPPEAGDKFTIYPGGVTGVADRKPRTCECCGIPMERNKRRRRASDGRLLCRMCSRAIPTSASGCVDADSLQHFRQEVDDYFGTLTDTDPTPQTLIDVDHAPFDAMVDHGDGIIQKRVLPVEEDYAP